MKVAICGAGVAGPTLAYWLLRGGHEPVLVEQAPSLRAGGYVIDFWGVGYTVAERMGILPAVRDAGYTMQELRFVDGRGRKAGGFSADAFRRTMGDRFTTLPRGDLAAEIYRAIEGRAETLFGDTISAIDEHKDGVRASFAKGGDRDFDLVIGADGLHSAIRHLTFGAEHQFENQLGYFVAAFEAEDYRPRDELAYVSYGAPGRQLARIALRENRTVFLFVFASARMSGREPRDLDDRKAVLHQVFDDAGWECRRILEAMDKSLDLYFDRVSQISMAAWSKGRVGLVGDAAACVSLLAGEGTGLAVTEAYVLAGELCRVGDDYREGFRRYEARLRPFIEAKQKSARNLAASFAPKTALGLWARNQAARLMGIPMVADLLIGRDMRDDFALPDYGI
jgi:2-polyprenyl-6-methoxyphenol hydroxylase-like FAD-dependent oxidoreductase